MLNARCGYLGQAGCYTISIAVRQRTVYDTIMISAPLKVWVCLAFVFLGVLTVAQVARAADTQPPSVTITQPTNGSTLNGVVRIAASVTDNVAVATVSFKLDGAPVGPQLASPPFSIFMDTASLAKGVHSLLAVATDTAGNTRRSALVQIAVTNAARYTLGPGPFTVENLGYVLSANTQDRQAFFQLSNDTHLLLYYDADYGTSPFQIIDVNLSQGTARLTNGVLGRLGVRGTVLYPNGKIYIGSSEAGGIGYFMEYDPTTGATRQIAQITGSDTQFIEIGDDGWIYNGEYPSVYVDRYNPNTDIYERLGSMSTNSSYAYTLGADSRYLYVGVGESPWTLVIYDTQTTSKTEYWATNGDSLGTVRHGTNGYWYYQRYIPVPYHAVWYQLTNGLPVELTNTPSGLFPEQRRGNVVDGVNYGYLMGYNVNLDYALPNSSSNYATIRYRTVGATNWQSVGVTNFHLFPSSISRLYPWDSTRLMGFSGFYGQVILYDINSHQTTALGYPQYNLYNGIFGHGVAYFSGYDAATLRYDPSLPWTRTGSTANKFDTNINPFQISLALRTHNYFSTFGSDGFVYIGSHIDRNGTGGTLGWWDPVTGTNGTLMPWFTNDDVVDLQPALGGTKLVYVSINTNLFIFDVATKSIDRIINPVGTNQTAAVGSGLVSGLDKVVEIAPGIMFGVGWSNIFKVNITDGSILYSNTLPGNAFQQSISLPNRRLVLGPDGYIWMFRWYRDAQNFNKSSLYRISPEDGSYSVIVTNTYYTYGENNLMFNGGDMYWYGRTNLWRIHGLLIPVGPTPPQALSVVLPGQ